MEKEIGDITPYPIQTAVLPPLLDEEVLFEFRCKRLSEDDRLRLVDTVVGEAAKRGATGAFRRAILSFCEEPLLNVQRYQNLRIEVKDLKICFRTSFTQQNRYVVTISNLVYPADAEPLALYLASLQSMDPEAARARVREVLPQAETLSQKGSGIGLSILRRRSASFEFSMIPDGDFIYYTLRIALESKEN